MKNQLIEKLNNKTAVIGVIGLGYVGLPLILRYAEVGYKVLGIDIDQEKVELLNNGKSYIEHISSEKIAEKVVELGFEATTDFSRSTEADALILCVPTPLNKYREPDLSYVTDTTDAILPYLRRGQVLSLESTTYPGTTEEELLPRMESTELKVSFLFIHQRGKIQAIQISRHILFLKSSAGTLLLVWKQERLYMRLRLIKWFRLALQKQQR